MDLEFKYYYNKKGKVKGIKSLNNNISIYLLEFINYDRIWAMRQEIEFS